MEMETLTDTLSWWNELPEDLEFEILCCLPAKVAFRYRIVCKRWKELLLSKYFISRLRKQPLLVVVDLNPEKRCMCFDFVTHTWNIKSLLTHSFVQEWSPILFSRRSVKIHSSQPGAGLVLACAPGGDGGPLFGKVSNPHTQTFVEIPAFSTRSNVIGECIVVDEKKNELSEIAYKVVVVRYPIPFRAPSVEIYEPSQKQWIVAGYLPDNITTLSYSNTLLFWDGSFHCYWRSSILRFSIPLEGNGNGTSAPIPVLFIPFPDGCLDPQMIACGSRLLLIEYKIIPVEGGGEEAVELVFRVWELIKDDGPSNPQSQSFKWVAIAQMPPSRCRECMDKFMGPVTQHIIGVGSHVCLISVITISDQHRVIEVLDYDLTDNTWNWLPSFDRNCRDIEHTFRWTPMAFEPSPYLKVE